MKLLWALLVLAPAFAVAQRTPKERAYSHLSNAYDHYRKGEFEAAIEGFQKAYTLAPEPRFLLNIALSHGSLNRCVEALNAYSSFFKSCADCPQRASGLRSHRLQRQACEATLEVDSRPRSEVVVDGEPRGMAPVELTLTAGPHLIEVSATGHEAFQEKVVLSAGLSMKVIATLQRDAPPSPAFVWADNVPEGAIVTLDGEALGADPLSLKPGPFTLEAQLVSGDVIGVSDTARSGRMIRIDLGGEPPPSLRPWAWTALTTGAVGVIAGSAFVYRLDQNLETERTAIGRSNVEAARDDATFNALGAQIAFGAGLVGLGTGLVLWVLEPKRREIGTTTTGQSGLNIAPDGMSFTARF